MGRFGDASAVWSVMNSRLAWLQENAQLETDHTASIDKKQRRRRKRENLRIRDWSDGFANSSVRHRCVDSYFECCQSRVKCVTLTNMQ